MNSATARQARGLPVLTLTLLTALVLLAHGLLLQLAAPAWGPVPDPKAAPPRPFITRTLQIQPAPALAAAPQPAPPRVQRRPARPPAPVSQEKTAAALSPPALSAIESIAEEAPAELAPAAAGSAAEAAEAAEAPPAADSAAPADTPPPLTGASTALTIPGSVRLKYVMTGRSKNLDYSAFAELNWLQDGQTYDASMVVGAFFLGTRSMSSSGRITADGLAPIRFLDKSRSERAAHFQADKGKITFSANTPDAPWLAGAQDRLSVFLQLGSLLAGAPANYPVGSTLALYTAGPRDAETWTFTVEAQELLNLPAGSWDTLKLTRKPQREFDQRVEIWFAPGLDYLPVRSRITQSNGDFIDQQLRVAEKP